MTEDWRGVGWAFPLQLAPRPEPPIAAAERTPAPPGPDVPDHAIALSAYDLSIRESILLIVGTSRGERVMRPDFGCGLHDLVFSSNDSVTAARVSHEIREALVEWEPRAEVLSIDVGADPAEAAKLLISIEYRVRATNNIFNLVYPFYLESSGVRP